MQFYFCQKWLNASRTSKPLKCFLTLINHYHRNHSLSMCAKFSEKPTSVTRWYTRTYTYEGVQNVTFPKILRRYYMDDVVSIYKTCLIYWSLRMHYYKKNKKKTKKNKKSRMKLKIEKQLRFISIWVRYCIATYLAGRIKKNYNICFTNVNENKEELFPERNYYFQSEEVSPISLWAIC